MRLSLRTPVLMLHRPISVPLPRQRLSPAGVAASGVLHIGLLWLLLQYAPVQQAVRYVVVQALRPGAPPVPASPPPSRAITLPASPGTAGDPLSVFTLRPESSMPLRTTDTLPDTLKQEKPRPRRQRRETPRPQPDAAPASRLRTETQL